MHPLLDHCVGNGERRRWYGEAERPGDVEVDDQLEFRFLNDWKVCRLFCL